MRATTRRSMPPSPFARRRGGRRPRLLAIGAIAALAPLLALAAPPASPARPESASGIAILPPPLPWDGKSRSLVRPPNDRWVTPCEASGMSRTPRYDETVAYALRLDEASDDVSMVSLGRSAEGREIWMIVAAKDGGARGGSGATPFSPEALRAGGKPTLLAQAGIHAGEIDGKDAGLMLLRDMTVGGRRRELLDRANFLFVPIFNVDGHERFSPYGRINQRGPEEMGWRTTARNLNLNRDYMKADAPEMQAMIRAINVWDPDLYFDLHVTDGIDYQYDITYGFSDPGLSPNGAAWMRERLVPRLDADLSLAGHIPGPLIFAVDDKDLAHGILDWAASPRFSNGYGDARHLPTLLVENHSLKPYEQRVLGTYVLLESALSALGEGGGELRAAIERDRAQRPREVVLDWKVGVGDSSTITFLGVRAQVDTSEVSGGRYVEWTGRPDTLQIPYFRAHAVDKSVIPPAAYWIPAAYPDLVGRLALHGVRMETITEERALEVETYVIEQAKIEPAPYEGRPRVSGAPWAERRTVVFPPGSTRVPTDQPLGALAALLLEPESGDSFFQWGFFLEFLQETEYSEAYVVEPMARRMLAESAELRTEFERKVAEDSAFAASPGDRLRWFYRKTPFGDPRWRVYPIAREGVVARGG